jgi:DNA (cytosine-5)-methyltransferase 1
LEYKKPFVRLGIYWAFCRKLTPKECLMLQGFPQDYSIPENMANSHVYKQAGNSFTVPVIKRIATNIIKVLDDKAV